MIPVNSILLSYHIYLLPGKLVVQYENKQQKSKKYLLLATDTFKTQLKVAGVLFYWFTTQKSYISILRIH